MIVAYSARTGEQLWRWSNRRMEINDIAADPSRARLYLTGGDRWGSGQLFLTSALDGRTGERIWRSRLDPPGPGSSNHVVVAPEGGQVYIAGSVRSDDAKVHWLVVAYGGSSGSRRWTGHLGRAYRYGFASELSVTPEGAPVLAGTVDVQGDCHAAAGALAPSDGARSWFRVLGPTQDCGFELLAAGRTSIFVEWEDRDPTLASLDPSDGTVIWSHDLPRLRLVFTLVATPSVLVVEGGIRRHGTVAAFDSDDGARGVVDRAATRRCLRDLRPARATQRRRRLRSRLPTARGSVRHGARPRERRTARDHDLRRHVVVHAVGRPRRQPAPRLRDRRIGPKARTDSPKTRPPRPPTTHGRDRNKIQVPWRRRLRRSRCRDVTSRSRAPTRSTSPMPREDRSRSSRSWSTGPPWRGSPSTGVVTGRRSCRFPGGVPARTPSPSIRSASRRGRPIGCAPRR